MPAAATLEASMKNRRITGITFLFMISAYSKNIYKFYFKKPETVQSSKEINALYCNLVSMKLFIEPFTFTATPWSVWFLYSESTLAAILTS